jgi:TetR/AcrR family transcriptional regulator
MKPTFDRLPQEKRAKIVDACVEEFAERGYEEGSTDRICRSCAISKGGLYEYIESKEELFLLAIWSAYSSLYGYILDSAAKSRKGLPSDPLDRFMRVSEIAIDFYIEHPRYIGLIQKANSLARGELKAKADAIFRDRFAAVFGDVDGSALRFPKDGVIDLIGWFLLKTRNDFLSGYEDGGSPTALKRAYLAPRPLRMPEIPACAFPETVLPCPDADRLVGI